MLNIIFVTFLCFSPVDSLRMETINGKPFVIHQVGEKETLYGISRRYGSTVAAILEHNPTADAGLEIGQILKVPYAPKPKSNPAVQTSAGLVHKVAEKETLFSIARQYNVSVDDIKSWNNLKESSLSVGQDILIRNKPSAAAVTVVKQPTGAKTHTVVAKETLYSIARQYGMTVQQLREWNGITGNEVSIGQVLTVAAVASTSTATPGVTGAATTTAATTKPVTSIASGQATTVIPSTNTIKISENVSGSDEVKEVGLAGLIQGTEGNRKYLGQHRTIKPGTILKIRNLSNNQEVFVRITDAVPLPDNAPNILISKSAYDRLGAAEPTFRAEITYYK